MARRKSSFSYANGNCVEVEDGWRTASHSQGASNCAEVSDWRKARDCNHGECLEVADFRKAKTCDGGSCVEVASGVAVRDTKNNGSGPVLTFTGPQWEVFIRAIQG